MVQVSEARSVLEAKTARSLDILRAFAAGLVIVSVALGWLFLRTITSRLDRLRQAAMQVGEGNFAARVPITGLSEFDRVGVAINQTAERVGGLIERERAFSSSASHQLRTPIASIRMAFETEILVPRTDRVAVLNEGLEALDQLDTTVTTLLSLARDTPSDRGILDIPGLFEGLVYRWRAPFHRQPGRAIRINPPGRPATNIRASAAAVQHVLDVLIENALHHGSGTVTVMGVPVTGGYTFRVHDEGSFSVDPDEIFERRTHSPLKSPTPATTGSHGGVGLPLARTLAAAEGADLSVTSSNPTTFDLLFATPTPDPRTITAP